MEENKTKKLENEAKDLPKENNGEILSAELLVAVNDIILEFKKSGSITTSQLFDKLEKFTATPSELEEIYKLVKSGGYDDMITFNMSLNDLCKRKLITQDVALQNSDSRNELQQMLRGVFTGTGKMEY